MASTHRKLQHYSQIVSQDFTNDKRTTCHTPRSTPAWIQFLNVLLHEGWPFRRDLNHWYERTLFKFPRFSYLIPEFLAIKAFDNKVRAKRVVRKIEIELNIPHYIFKYRKRYHVENENPPVNFRQLVQRVGFAFFCKSKSLFEILWPYMTKMLKRRYSITMSGAVGTYIPDLETPSPKTWTAYYLNVSLFTNMPSRLRQTDETTAFPLSILNEESVVPYSRGAKIGLDTTIVPCSHQNPGIRGVHAF
jgi:hypothetical protein